MPSTPEYYYAEKANDGPDVDAVKAAFGLALDIGSRTTRQVLIAAIDMAATLDIMRDVAGTPG